MWKSFKEYITLLGIWGWVVLIDIIGGVVGAYIDISGKANVPIWLWLGALVIGLAIVPFIAFHKLRVLRDNIHDKLVKQEWEYRKPHLIELRTPLVQIPSIICGMKRQLDTTTKKIISEKPSHAITRNMLEDISKHIYSKVGIPQTDNQTGEYLMRITWALDAHSIGLEEVLNSDTAWDNLKSQLTNIRNPDKELSLLIDRYLIYLKGMNSDRLHSHYLDIVYGEESERIENDKFVRRVNKLGASQYFEQYIHKLESKIDKRVEYLMAGGEAE